MERPPPRQAVPSPYGGAPGNQQDRTIGLTNDMAANAQKAGAEHFAGHWKDLTSSLDVNSTPDVTAFAAKYGVKPGDGFLHRYTRQRRTHDGGISPDG